MIVPVRRVSWEPCFRVIPTKFEEKRILGKLAGPEDFDEISDLEQMTNERLRQEKGEAALVAPNDVVTGWGSEYIMASFAYRNQEGSRFSDGNHGVYYTAHDRNIAAAETKHHREIFMSRTKEPPMLLEMRVLHADLDGRLHDIRGAQKKYAQIYSKSDYSAGQAWARDLVKSSSSGIVYDSVRHKGGQCAAVFRPPVLSHCRPAEKLIFEWDGKMVAKVYELKET